MEVHLYIIIIIKSKPSFLDLWPLAALVTMKALFIFLPGHTILRAVVPSSSYIIVDGGTPNAQANTLHVVCNKVIMGC